MHTSEQLVANMQLQERRLRELASGVDALYLSGRAELPKRFVARLEDCRAWAAEAKRPAPCQIGEHTFGIAPHGWGKYRFCLDHQMARIGFPTAGTCRRCGSSPGPSSSIPSVPRRWCPRCKRPSVPN